MSQSQSKKSGSIATTNLTRRQAMRGLAGGAAAVGAGSIGLRTSSQEVEAIAPAVVAGLGASAALGWAVRTGYDVLTADDPPEGLTAEALGAAIAQTATTRDSTNKSTFFDNRNIVQGLENILYTEGKIAAIEALQNGQSQTDVQNAAIDEADSFVTPVLENLLRSWNESAEEIGLMSEKVNDHPEYINDAISELYYDGGWEHSTLHYIDSVRTEETYTLPDGSTMDVITSGRDELSPISGTTRDGSGATAVYTGDDIIDVERVTASLTSDASATIEELNAEATDFLIYQSPAVWGNIYQDIIDVHTNVTDGLITWVDTVYSDVQAGELELSELITPRERAEMMADEETIAPAIADLIALNANVDPERDATITLVDDDVTLRGTFARTANPDGEPLESGETYDPDTLTGDIYFSYDVSQGQGIWSEYQNGVDGGTVTFTAEPFDSVEFLIETTAGETATVASSEFADNGDGTYSVDISGQVEDSITEIESVEMFPEDSETQFETVLLKQSFTIDKFEDSDGNEVQEASFEQSSEPQTDDNYITQEEWDDLEQRNQELIEKYEEAQSGGGGLFGAGGLLEGTNSRILIVVAAGLAAVGLLNN